MLLDIHQLGRRTQSVDPADPNLQFVCTSLHDSLARPNVFDRIRPGEANSEQIDPYTLGHLTAALVFAHAIEPDPAADAVMLKLLRWIPAQKALMWGANISLGQFLKGCILALDTVGEQLSADEREAILQHLILLCVHNPDPDHIANRHPTGAQPMLHMLQVPGFGFHLKDEQVNNWDVVCAQGLLYMSRAVEALLPARAANAALWRDVAVMRLRRFLRLAFTPAGEYGEGPSYYTYGTTAAILMLDTLDHWPNRPVDIPISERAGLHASPRWSRELYHGSPSDGCFNYNDSKVKTVESPGVVHWIAARSRDEEAQAYGDALRRLMLSRPTPDPEPLLYSFLWRDPALASRPSHGRTFSCFGRTGTAIVRTGYEAASFHAVVRAGVHAGAHTHPDRGNILLTAFGEDLLGDAGMPEDRTIAAYFSYHRSTAAHNCAIIGRQEQITETDRGYVRGVLRRADAGEQGAWIEADCTAVWPDASLVLRQVFAAWQGWLLVRERVETSKSPVELLFHTDNRDRRATIVIQGTTVILHRPAASLWIIPGTGLGAALDEGAVYHESDPSGRRRVRIRCTGPEAVYLLLPRTPAHAVPTGVLARAGDRQWSVTIDGQTTAVQFPDETASSNQEAPPCFVRA